MTDDQKQRATQDISEMRKRTNMCIAELEYVTNAIGELQDKMTDWLEKQVDVYLCVTADEALADKNDPLDEYVIVMEVEGEELVSFTDVDAGDLVDTLSIWAIRHLIISCGNYNAKMELPKPAEA
jgi:hypothetical protein